MITGECTILMEFKVESWVNSGTIVKADVCVEDTSDTARHIEDIIRCSFLHSAEIHARYWNNTTLLDMKWMKSVNWRQEKVEASFNAALDSTKRSWDIVKQAICGESRPYQVKWSTMVMECIEDLLQSSSWSSLQLELKHSPFTLCHGDFHANNVLWRQYRHDHNDNERRAQMDEARDDAHHRVRESICARLPPQCDGAACVESSTFSRKPH